MNKLLKGLSKWAFKYSNRRTKKRLTYLEKRIEQDQEEIKTIKEALKEDDKVLKQLDPANN